MTIKYQPGDHIIVTVDGEQYDTVIDDRGVQRFETNSVLRHLIDSKVIDLNKLSMDHFTGKFSKRDYARFYCQIGYSVCGFCDLGFTEEMNVENPAWD